MFSKKSALKLKDLFYREFVTNWRPTGVNVNNSRSFEKTTVFLSSFRSQGVNTHVSAK